MVQRWLRTAALVTLALSVVSVTPSLAKKKKHSTRTTKAKAEKNPRVKFQTDLGDFMVELWPSKAPKTVENFRKLVKQGFYDGLLFHRVERGFVLQGGDPNTRSGDPSTWGGGSPGYTFEDEPVKGEYTKGTLCMANSGPNTNGSQFFVCTADVPNLPKKYNLFGKVVDGMDVVDKINNVETVAINNGGMTMHRPVKPVRMIKLTDSP